MAALWSRIINTTTRNYIREVEIQTLRNRKLTALLKKRGRISYNWSGTMMDWKVKAKRLRPTPHAEGDTMEFSRKERYKTASLDWRGYRLTDAITKGEFLQNRGKEAIIKLFSTLSTDLMEDMEDMFSEEFFINGYSAGNSKRMHGIESCMSASQNVGNGAASPTGTYAGLSCVPGNYGGFWDGGPYNALTGNGWPNGRGDTIWDFWSPIVVDYGDTIFPGGTQNPYWSYNCVEAIAFALIKSKKSKSKKGSTDVIMLDDEMYRKYVAKQRALQRINVDRGSKSELVSLGFEDVFNQDGCDITFEYGMPPNVGYGWNVDNCELRSQQGQLFDPLGPEYDMATSSWRISVDFYGNFVVNPKFQFKLANLTNTSNPIGT